MDKSRISSPVLELKPRVETRQTFHLDWGRYAKKLRKLGTFLRTRSLQPQLSPLS